MRKDRPTSRKVDQGVKRKKVEGRAESSPRWGGGGGEGNLRKKERLGVRRYCGRDRRKANRRLGQIRKSRYAKKDTLKRQCGRDAGE